MIFSFKTCLLLEFLKENNIFGKGMKEWISVFSISGFLAFCIILSCGNSSCIKQAESGSYISANWSCVQAREVTASCSAEGRKLFKLILSKNEACQCIKSNTAKCFVMFVKVAGKHSFSDICSPPCSVFTTSFGIKETAERETWKAPGSE